MIDCDFACDRYEVAAAGGGVVGRRRAGHRRPGQTAAEDQEEDKDGGGGGGGAGRRGRSQYGAGADAANPGGTEEQDWTRVRTEKCFIS